MDIQDQSTLSHLLALEEGLYDLRETFLRERAAETFQQAFNKQDPLVSVVVATYNRCRLLTSRCLPSLLRQTYRNLQIVVVGDGCSDDTEQAVATIRDSRICFENLPKNGPYPASFEDRWRVAGTYAMNRGLELSEGEFIAHLDDDDEASPERIENLLRFAQAEQIEFLWHRFLAQTADGLWRSLGTPRPELGQITTGCIFYHRYFRKVPWDVRAYRTGEPGDWNRIRKILFLQPNSRFLDECLTIHYEEQKQPVESLTTPISCTGENYLYD